MDPLNPCDLIRKTDNFSLLGNVAYAVGVE